MECKHPINHVSNFHIQENEAGNKFIMYTYKCNQCGRYFGTNKVYAGDRDCITADYKCLHPKDKIEIYSFDANISTGTFVRSSCKCGDCGAKFVTNGDILQDEVQVLYYVK
jgi:DNA-directed RNA polymerase subunit RPC12/RpoP